MTNLKRLSRNDLKDVLGGRRACSVAVKQANGSWVTHQGECKTAVDGQTFINNGNGLTIQFSTHQYCETGSGEQSLSSNGGVSHCND